MPLRRRGTQARRRPHRRTALAVPAVGRHERFERLVERALDGLPAHVQRLRENVAIVIEDEPTTEQLRTSGLARDETLYGLYEGTPAVEYGADWVPFPNKISLFRLPLEEDFPDPHDLADQVRLTVIHELAHHAGIDEGRLERYGVD
ncbi:MAG: metallopeptidase family protein [Chloroflexota bacterium]|nr:metallopeptidase family protein [Chloroflexota bacterium]